MKAFLEFSSEVYPCKTYERTFLDVRLQRLHDGLCNAGGIHTSIGESGTDLHPPQRSCTLADARECGESLHPRSDESAADESHGEA